MALMFLLKIIIWIIAYTAGVARLSLACILLKRNKRREDFWKVAFLLIFSLIIISLTNMEVFLALESGNLYIFGYISEYAAALIIMTLPLYIHAAVENRKKRVLKDNLFISLSLFLCLMLTLGYILDIQKLNDIIFGVVIALMSLSVIYSNLLPLLEKKSEKKQGSLMKTLSISVILLIPLMIWIDFMNRQIAGFIVLPIMYFIINVLMILSEIDELNHKGVTENVSLKQMLASGLTRREQEVAGLLLQGLTYQQTADRLCISIQTVKTHANRIYSKTDSKNKMDLHHKLIKIRTD
ncbi:MAG: helix-turn-helix transcriptional regulator [Spirochaetaceae bacterium]|nr:helix-turn-helix transcriptional regulator [Spirochaetaceae bacterium]